MLGRLFAKTTVQNLQVELYKETEAIVLEIATFLLTILIIGLSIGKLRESYADLDFVSKKLSEKGAAFKQEILKF